MGLSIAELIVVEAAQDVALRGSAAPPAPDRTDRGLYSVPFGTASSSALRDLLSKRVSSRALSGPLPVESLMKVLSSLCVPVGEHRARIGIATTGGLRAQKVLCAVTNVEGLEAGLYEIDWQAEVLHRLEPSSEALQAMLSKVALFLGAQLETPAAVLLIVADWQRIDAVYEGATLVSSLWDAGSFIGHLYLAAAEAGVSCCAVSALDEGALVGSVGLDAARWGHVGTVALGGFVR